MASFIHSPRTLSHASFLRRFDLNRAPDSWAKKVSSQILFRIVETALALIVLFCEEKFIRLAANQNKKQNCKPTHTHTDCSISSEARYLRGGFDVTGKKTFSCCTPHRGEIDLSLLGSEQASANPVCMLARAHGCLCAYVQ